MSLNVPPAMGVSPEEAAKQLRVLVKQVLGAVGVSGGDSEVIANRNCLHHFRKEAQSYRDSWQTVLDELDEAATRRRPNEIRGLLARIRKQADKEMNCFARERKYADWFIIQMTGGSAEIGQEETLKRIYALVQSLPTIPAAPATKEEDTIRAIGAIVKAYYGVFDQAIEDIPLEGDLPFVLLRKVQMIEPSDDPDTHTPDTYIETEEVS